MNYCISCQKPVKAKRRFTFFDFFFVIMTGGLWILAVALRKPTCPICGMQVVKLR